MPTHGIHLGRGHGLLRGTVGLTRGGLTLGLTLGPILGHTPGPTRGGPTVGPIPGPILGHTLGPTNGLTRGVGTLRVTPPILGASIRPLGRSMCPPTLGGNPGRVVIRMILTAADTTRHIIPPITHTTNPVTLRCS